MLLLICNDIMLLICCCYAAIMLILCCSYCLLGSSSHPLSTAPPVGDNMQTTASLYSLGDTALFTNDNYVTILTPDINTGTTSTLPQSYTVLSDTPRTVV